MIYKLSVFKGARLYHINCPDLVGKGSYGHWYLPAVIMGISLVDFVRDLVAVWDAKIDPYYDKDGKLIWISYSWINESDANAFRDYINSLARKKNFLI